MNMLSFVKFPESREFRLFNTTRLRLFSRYWPFKLKQISIQSSPKYLNSVYYPNWKVYDGVTPASIDYDCINHVFYAFAKVNENGTVELGDKYCDLEKPVDGTTGCISSLRHVREKYGGLKLILSIGGGSGSAHFAAVARSPAARRNFALTCKQLVTDHGFNGIDIDWEHPDTPEQGNNFIELLQDIRAVLPSPQYVLTAALPAGKWALQNIDLYKARHYLDFINLMAYDFSGNWSAMSGHHAQLYAGGSDEPSGAGAVDYVLSTGYPAAKILFGVPAYGWSFLGTNGPKQAKSGNGGNDGAFEYRNLPRPGATEMVDRNVVAAYCVGGDGGFVSYDNPETVRIKGEYVKNKGLGGLFFWTGTGDSSDGNRRLVSVGYNSMNR